MRSAKIENDIVTNIIVGEMDGYIECPDNVGIGWSYNNDTENFSSPELPGLSVEDISDQIKQCMDVRISQGVKWAFNGGSTVYDVPLSRTLQEFLSRNLMKLNEDRLSPHKGFVFNGTEKFDIDDDGLRELAVFAGEWGDEISRIRLDEIESLGSMSQTQLENYDPPSIDWSVDWSIDPQNNGKGWVDDLCKQNP